MGLAWLTAPAAAASPIVVDKRSPDTLEVQGHVSVALDPEQVWTLEMARRAEYRAVGQRDYSRPPGDADVWLRLTVENGDSEPLERLLVLRFRLIDSVEIHALYSDGTLVQGSAGEDTEVEDRLVGHALPAVSLRLQPGASVTVWLRLRDPGTIDAPLLLMTATAFIDHETTRNLLHGVFMGSVLLLVAFSLFLAVVRRKMLYAWFAVYLAAELLLSLVYFWGGGGMWIPAEIRPWLVNRLIVAGAVAMFWASLQFASHLLDLATHMPRTFVWLRRAAWFGYPVVALATLVVPYGIAVVLSVLALVPVLVPVWSSIARARRDRVALLYAMSWLVLILAVASVYLRVIGILPARFPTAYFLYTGFFLQFSVFCAAMARRVGAIERERRQALEAELAAYQRNAALSRSFERFVPKAFLDRLERTSITDVELGHAVERRMTVLFSDIRSFTTLVEHMTPEENFAFINEYLSYMEPAIHQHLGFIDKYIGDVVMALFDDEDGDSGGALQAVQAAIGMHEALDRYNALRAERGDEPVLIGIGLHTGSLMLGTIGGRHRLNASVIGDAVNLASRVEGLTKRYGAAVVLTRQVSDCIPATAGLRVRSLDKVRVRGKSEPVEILQLLDCEPPDMVEQLLAALPAFQAGRVALSDGRLEEARQHFLDALDQAPEDKACRIHLESCERLLYSGLPDDWDGVVPAH